LDRASLTALVTYFVLTACSYWIMSITWSNWRCNILLLLRSIFKTAPNSNWRWIIISGLLFTLLMECVWYMKICYPLL